MQGIDVSKACITGCLKVISPAIEILDSGRDFTIIDGSPIDRYNVEQTRVAYWIIGKIIGIPLKQNLKGTLLYDVCNKGVT